MKTSYYEHENIDARDIDLWNKLESKDITSLEFDSLLDEYFSHFLFEDIWSEDREFQVFLQKLAYIEDAISEEYRQHFKEGRFLLVRYLKYMVRHEQAELICDKAVRSKIITELFAARRLHFNNVPYDAYLLSFLARLYRNELRGVMLSQSSEKPILLLGRVIYHLIKEINWYQFTAKGASLNYVLNLIERFQDIASDDNPVTIKKWLNRMSNVLMTQADRESKTEINFTILNLRYLIDILLLDSCAKLNNYSVKVFDDLAKAEEKLSKTPEVTTYVSSRVGPSSPLSLHFTHPRRLSEADVGRLTNDNDKIFPL